MKIFSLPYLVINELIRQFEPTALIHLSFCSKRAHSVVKMFAKNRKGDELQLSSHFPNVYSLSVSKKILIHAFSNRTRHLDTSTLQTMHGLNWSVDGYRNLYTYWQDVAVGFRDTTNYVRDLLNVPVSTVYIYCAADVWMLDVAEKGQEQRLKSVYIGNIYTVKAYSRVMSCNATQHLECELSPQGNYRFDGKLPTAKNLSLTDGSWITREHLLGLESQSVQLCNTKLKRSDIRALLRSWLNGGLSNLKYLKVIGAPHDDRIYRGIRHRLERVQEKVTYKGDTLDKDVEFDTYAFHIRRDDGVVATVMSCIWTFTMAVWPDLNGNRV